MAEDFSIPKRKFEAFIEGEVIDLCVPSKESWIIDEWYKWFNDEHVTKYLDQGVYPNTYEKQEMFCQSLMENDDRIALLIRPKSKDYFVGVASLSSIEHKKRSCDFAMVIGKQDHSPESMFYAMEAKCRMTEHAFEKVGVERVNSGQVVELIRWQRWQVLFGYQIEGILRRKMRKGNNAWDVMISSCLLEDYLKLKDLRNGSLWPGKKRLFELMKNLPEESTIDLLLTWLESARQKTWETIFSIERGEL